MSRISPRFLTIATILIVIAAIAANANWGFDMPLLLRQGLPFSPPNLTGQWRFYVPPGPTFPVGSSPTSRTYTPVASTTINDDYIGLLIGETTGNWMPGAARPVSGGQSAVHGGSERDIVVELPQMVTQTDKEIVVPIRVHGAANKDIISCEFDLQYDPAVIQPFAEIADLKGTVSSGFSVVVNPYEPRLLRVVVYGAYPIYENGVLLNLRFTAVGAAGSVSPLTFERIMFNEGEATVSVTDGRIELF